MRNVPTPILYGFGIVFVAALFWVFYLDKGVSLAKLSAPAAATSVKK